MEKGYVQIYTGNGKGKTTASLGLLLRAVGAGHRVFFGQFLKNDDYSEAVALKELLPMVTFMQFGSGGGFARHSDPRQAEYDSAETGLKEAAEALTCGKYDVVILDEINVSAHLGHISVPDILNLIDQKPDNVELVLTGRHAADKVIEKADLVTEMVPVKHYFEKGVKARKGIEK